MGTVHMLTTTDNPFDPFTQYDDWFAYDTRHGYGSLSLLARVIHTSDDLSDVEESEAIEMAIKDIVNENFSGIHRMVAEGEMNSISTVS